jgi:hypothetical protein
MSTSLKSAVEQSAGELLADRVSVDSETVAAALAAEIVNEHIDDLCPESAVEAGINAAIEQIDEPTFTMAVEVIGDRVAEEVERQAKQIALRLLAETARKAERAMQATAEHE